MTWARALYSTLNILFIQKSSSSRLRSDFFSLFFQCIKFGVSRAFHSGSHAICCCWCCCCSDLFLTSSSHLLPPHWSSLTSCAQSTMKKNSPPTFPNNITQSFIFFLFSRIVPTLFTSRAESLSTWTGVLDSSCYHDI